MRPVPPTPVVIALGSNLGDRQYELNRALREMSGLVRLVRISPVYETAPVDAPPGSNDFLNMVVAGWTRLGAETLLEGLHGIESTRGRERRVRHEPRHIDLDLILYGAHRIKRPRIEVPHPRYRARSFVMDPLRALNLPWVDPATGMDLL